MNQEIKKKWLEALRSGQYKQSRKKLKSTKGFCCLGVLCDIHRIETKSGDRWKRGECKSGFEYLGSVGILPDEVKDWAGLQDENPRLEDNRFYGSIAEMNDFGCDFEEIAKVIEEKF